MRADAALMSSLCPSVVPTVYAAWRSHRWWRPPTWNRNDGRVTLRNHRDLHAVLPSPRWSDSDDSICRSRGHVQVRLIEHDDGISIRDGLSRSRARGWILPGLAGAETTSAMPMPKFAGMSRHRRRRDREQISGSWCRPERIDNLLGGPLAAGCPDAEMHNVDEHATAR